MTTLKKNTIILSILFLSACSISPITGERISTLKEGESKENVLSIVGKPDNFETKNNITIFKYSNRYMSGWGNSKTDYYLSFKNDKLISITNGEIKDNSKQLTETLQRMSEQAERKAQREHETTQQLLKNLSNNQPQKIYLCKNQFYC